MIRDRIAAGATVLGMIIAGVTVLAWRQDPPVAFRSRTDLVLVDVAVRYGKKPVKGMTTPDFVLRDNGVAQQIEATTIEQVPVDLTLILDVSDSTSPFIEDFKTRAQTINEMLRDGDRVRLIAVASQVLQIFPFRPGGSTLPVSGLRPLPGTSINDALALALVRGADQVRRQLIVTFTDAMDTSSVSNPADVVSIAREATAVLQVVLFGFGDTHAGARAFREAAEQTGGQAYPPGAFTTAIDAFAQIFEDFRHSYVLSYIPRGVKSEGWHDITVTMANPAASRFTVRAKKGYVGAR